MRRNSIALAGISVGAFAAFIALGLGRQFATAQSAKAVSYAKDRAEIEDLQARYLFALDFKDHDLYVTTFFKQRLRINPGPPASY